MDTGIATRCDVVHIYTIECSKAPVMQRNVHVMLRLNFPSCWKLRSCFLNVAAIYLWSARFHAKKGAFNFNLRVGNLQDMLILTLFSEVHDLHSMK